VPGPGLVGSTLSNKQLLFFPANLTPGKFLNLDENFIDASYYPGPGTCS
jgi:hypothetical protein